MIRFLTILFCEQYLFRASVVLIFKNSCRNRRFFAAAFFTSLSIHGCFSDCTSKRFGKKYQLPSQGSNLFFLKSEKTFEGLRDSIAAYICQSHARNKNLISHLNPCFLTCSSFLQKFCQ